MTEHLRPCPFCGTAPHANVNGDPTGFGATIECIAGKCSVNPRVRADAPTLGRAEEWAAKQWQRRALGPALDVVLAEAEAMEASGDVVIWGNDTDRIRIGWMRDLIAMLRALRDATSPTATPSGSGAQSGTGDAGE